MRWLEAVITRAGLRPRLALAGLALLAVGGIPSGAAERVADDATTLRDGDRWAAVGDSITHTGTYHAWVHLFYLTRYPGRTIEVLNTGIAGDTAAGGLRRFAWDVMRQRPTVATVDFGMNDVMRGLYVTGTPSTEQQAGRKAAIATLVENEKALVAQLQAAGVRVILLTPSIFDDEAELPAAKLHGVNAALGEAAQGLRALAREARCGLVDWHGPMLELNRALQKKDPSFTLTGPDRIHPGPDGHFVMAYLFLKAQGVPAEVSRLGINAATLRVDAVNGRAGPVTRVGRGLSLEWTEGSLPFPMDASVARARTWVPFDREFNQETLQVTGLEPGRYELRIDGRVIRAATAADLAGGLNLATEAATPQYEQALEVLKIVKTYTHLSAETLRNLALVEHQTMPADRLPGTLEGVRPFWEAKYASFKTAVPSANLRRIYDLYVVEKPREEESRQEIARLQEQARRAAQPRTHRYEIVPIRESDGPVRP